MLAAFIAFRLFDIWKPWPISWLDHHVKGGLGVMVDDLAAAVLAYLSVLLALAIGHGFTASHVMLHAPG